MVGVLLRKLLLGSDISGVLLRLEIDETLRHHHHHHHHHYLHGHIRHEGDRCNAFEQQMLTMTMPVCRRPSHRPGLFACALESIECDYQEIAFASKRCPRTFPKDTLPYCSTHWGASSSSDLAYCFACDGSTPRTSSICTQREWGATRWPREMSTARDWEAASLEPFCTVQRYLALEK